MEFFKPSDLQLVFKWGDVDYDPDNPQHTAAGEKIKNGPATKTQFWCQQVSKKVGMTHDCKRVWHKQGGKLGTKFRPYTWGKIYDSKSAIKDIYFTVGIRGAQKPVLHIKIDRQFEKTDELSEEQLEIASQMLTNNQEYRYEKKIELSDLSDYDWERLIDETVSFIEENKKTYYKTIERVRAKRSRFFTRICWNSFGWQEPSGPNGKSKNQSTFEGITGIGHEEWLFSDKLRIGEFQYGFLQANNLDNKPSIFDVDLFTLHNTSEGLIPYYVASIQNLEVLSKEQKTALKEKTKFITKYIKENTTSDQWQRLLELFSDYEALPNINVRFKISEVTFPDDDNLIPIDLDVRKNHRYQLREGTLFDHISLKPTTEVESTFLELSDTGRERGSNGSRTVSRSAGSHQSQQEHIKLSEKLEKYLNTIKADEDSVISERGLGSKSIDMVWETPDEYIFFEIKTYANITQCIRDAIGQLLEYAYYRRNKVNKDYKLIITSPHAPDHWIKEYIELLRNRFDLPLHYQQFNMSEGVLKQMI